MDGSAAHKDKDEEEELSSAHAELELPSRRGHPSRDVTVQLHDQYHEPSTRAGDA